MGTNFARIMNWLKEKLIRFKRWLIALFIGSAAISLTVANFTDETITVDVVEPAPAIFAYNRDVVFKYRDDNTNENLIIRSDRSDYRGQSDVYVSIQNTTAVDQDILITFSFNDKTSIDFIEKYNPLGTLPTIVVINGSASYSGFNTQYTKITKTAPDRFNDSILAGKTNFYRVFISQNTVEKKFLIEAIGTSAYGKLD